MEIMLKFSLAFASLQKLLGTLCDGAIVLMCSQYFVHTKSTFTSDL